MESLGQLPEGSMPCPSETAAAGQHDGVEISVFARVSTEQGSGKRKVRGLPAEACLIFSQILSLNSEKSIGAGYPASMLRLAKAERQVQRA